MSKGFDTVIDMLDLAIRRIDNATMSLAAHELSHEEMRRIYGRATQIAEARYALLEMARQRHDRWHQYQPARKEVTETDS